MHGVTADLTEIGVVARDLLERPTSAIVVICPPATLLAIASRDLDQRRPPAAIDPGQGALTRDDAM